MRKRLLWLAVVIAPTLAAVIYYGLWVTPRYVSEAEFVVRGLSSSRLTGLDALFKTFGIARTVDDTNIVQSYILSRDAVNQLQSDIDIRAIFSDPQADMFSRFPRFWESNSFEGLYAHYAWRVKVIQDTTRGISTVHAEAFRAEDAQRIASQVLTLAERLVNRLNERAQADATRSAEEEVQRAEQRVLNAQMQLTQFRNAATLVDPAKSSSSALDTITALTRDLVQAQAQIQQLQQTSPSTPQIAVLQARIEALKGRIETERGKLAGNDGSLAAKVSTYETLTLNRDLADKSLAAATLSLESVRSEARRQQIYIEKIAQPNLPDEPTEPRRLRLIITVLMTALMSYAVIWILSVGAKEKAQ
ncbi:capsule biosynthesis protein [Labrys sp. 22185]|uniref:capsule biosynthesis protein n=1 Tax=Labrys sp. 22185 TaxID=3453888 RepID=UPI003F83E887